MKIPTVESSVRRWQCAYFRSAVCADKPTKLPAVDLTDGAVAYTRSSAASSSSYWIVSALLFESAHVLTRLPPCLTPTDPPPLPVYTLSKEEMDTVPLTHGVFYSTTSPRVSLARFLMILARLRVLRRVTGQRHGVLRCSPKCSDFS